ncbi:hypothetical protein NPIL_227331, partial [Nephila pilipes]
MLIQLIPMIPAEVPFIFKRLQLPLRLAFSVIINKAEGQLPSAAGLNL